MPQTFYITQPDAELCMVTKNGRERTWISPPSTRACAVHVRRAEQANVLERRPGEVYVHYVGTDKRMDEWVSETNVKEEKTGHQAASGTSDANSNGTANGGLKKRKRSHNVDEPGRTARLSQVDSAEGEERGPGVEDERKTLKMSEEEYDLEHHKKITARRNFDKVVFGKWSIRTWYFSPYPLMENEIESEPSSTPAPPSHFALPQPSASHTSRAPPTSIGPRLPRATVRSHGRTSDLFAGGLGRERTHGVDGKESGSVLWVCDRCFKYMTEGTVWEGHCVCLRKSSFVPMY